MTLMHRAVQERRIALILALLRLDVDLCIRSGLRVEPDNEGTIFGLEPTSFMTASELARHLGDNTTMVILDNYQWLLGVAGQWQCALGDRKSILSTVPNEISRVIMLKLIDLLSIRSCYK